nr:reverse transcriptase domain-containing protein [Tanacetum cinerariifolium]
VENSNFEEHLPPVATMTDNRIMAEMLRAPTEGCAEEIVVPSILAEQFEHSLINMMTSEQFFGLKKDNPHDHIRGNLFEKSPQDALTIIENKSKVCSSRIKPIASPVNACDINSSSEIAKLTHAVNLQSSAVTIAMTAMLKQLQATPPPAPVMAVEEICVTCGAACNYNQGNPGYRPQGVANQMRPHGFGQPNSFANPKGELKAITTRSGLVSDGPTVPTPPKSVTPEEDECVEETYTDPDLAEYTIKVPPPPVQKHKPLKMLKALLSNKEKLQELANIPLNENCSTIILKKLPKKLGDPGKFLIPCGFSELKCKALVDLGASINLMPLSVWRKLGLPDLIPTRMTLELTNRAICTPDGITSDVFVPVGKFTFPADFVVLDYESDPRVPLILGRPFLRTARALIDVRGEEMILRDGDERLTLNMKHDTTSYYNHPHKESVNLINIFNVSSENCLEELPDIDSFNDIHPYFDDNPLSGSTTYSSNALLEEFTDELALITYPQDYDDNLLFDIEFDVYDDNFLEIESDADNFYNDPFDSKGEKIKESKLLIDELDLACDFLPYPEYDSFNSQDFSRVDDLPSPNNEDKVFNPGILIQEKSVTIITRVAQEKKLAISKAFLVFEDFDPPFYDPIIFKDVPNLIKLLLFSSKNEKKVFKPGIYTSEKSLSSLKGFEGLYKEDGNRRHRSFLVSICLRIDKPVKPHWETTRGKLFTTPDILIRGVKDASQQPLPPVVSPTAESPEYVVESDLEEDPEEYEDDEKVDGPIDYPMDERDDDNGDSSGDDADDEDKDEEEEEEEHLAPADSAIVIPTDKLVSPPEGTEPVMPPPSTDIATTGARITV